MFKRAKYNRRHAVNTIRDSKENVVPLCIDNFVGSNLRTVCDRRCVFLLRFQCSLRLFYRSSYFSKMAVLCPAYDPICGWYVMVSEPDGPKMKLITSPLHYYHQIGVAPPVGAIFSDDDYLDLEVDLSLEEDNGYLDDADSHFFPKVSSDSYELPPVTTIGSSKSSIVPIIPEAKFSGSLPEKTNTPQYAPIIPEIGVPKSPTTPQFSSILYNHLKKNTSSFEAQPSTSNTFQNLYSPAYSSFNKNLMSSTYNGYAEDDDDYNMDIFYDDPYGEPHNM